MENAVVIWDVMIVGALEDEGVGKFVYGVMELEGEGEGEEERNIVSV